MILPTRKFVDMVAQAESQNAVADTTGIDRGLFSKLISRERGASAMMIERIYRWCRWSMDDTWEVVDGKEEDA